MASILRRFFLFFMIITLTSLALSIPASQAQLRTGDILVTDEFESSPPGILFIVNPSTGQRTILSDFSDPTQGPIGDGLGDVAVEASGNILVTDESAGTGGNGALFRINPVTGVRTILSDFGDADQGQTGGEVGGVAVEASGSILVVDENVLGNGALFRIDPTTGVRTVLSDFSIGVNLGDSPAGVAVEASGNILVIDEEDGTGNGALFRIDPMTGTRTILSDFSDGTKGPTGGNPDAVAVEASGTILVVDEDADTGYNALFRIDPVTGVRTILSDFSDGGQGPLGDEIAGVAVEPSGSILVTDESEGVLFRVNPSTGSRIILSDFSDAGEGQTGANPAGVAVYRVIPPPVGGISAPINKFEILAPYIALAGLIAAVSAVYVIKKRKD
jgi:DNA-binding beta-propeller fold protein YncE